MSTLMFVSVPLRGNGRETSPNKNLSTFNFLVSVPLRGNGRETGHSITDMLIERAEEFPSPCGEMVVKRLTCKIYKSLD